MPYCFPRSSIKFQGHTVQNITDFDPNWAFPEYRPVAAFKSLRFALFKVKHYFGHISGMVGPIDVKQKGSALVGYWVQYVTLTFHFTHDLDLGCFKVKFRNSSISGIVGMTDVK